MKKIFFWKCLLLALFGVFNFVHANGDSTDKTLGKKEIQAKAKTYCEKPVYRLYLDYNTTRDPQKISVDEPRQDLLSSEIDSYGFEKNSGYSVLGYWFDAIDGEEVSKAWEDATETKNKKTKKIKAITDEDLLKTAKERSANEFFADLQTTNKSNANDFLCPNIDHVSDNAYSSVTSDALNKFLCRQNLLILLESGCEKIDSEKSKERADEVSRVYNTEEVDGKYVRSETDSRDESFENFKDSLPKKEDFQSPLSEIETAINKKYTLESKRDSLLNQAKQIWDKMTESVSSANSAIDGWYESIEESKDENSDTNKEKLILNGNYLFDLSVSHYKSVTKSIEEFDEYVSDNLKDEFLTKYADEDVYKKAEAALNLYKTQEDKINEISKKYSDEGISLRHKQKYIQERINQLAFSSISKGVSSFDVSKILVTKNDGKGKVSKEGKWTLFDNEVDENGGNSENFFDKIIKLVTGVVGTLGVIILIIAIVMLVTANGDDTQIGKAKELILYALGGLFVIFTSYIVIQFVIDLLVW